MPFGRHRGKALSELPGGYVAWLGGKLDEWREPFRSDLAAELARRKGETLPDAVNGSPQTPARRRAPRRTATELPATATCSICGLGATAQRPLLHLSCTQDGVPF